MCNRCGVLSQAAGLPTKPLRLVQRTQWVSGRRLGSAIADSAAGYAALGLMLGDTGVLTTEFKINLLAPAAGERLLARGRAGKQAVP